MKPPVFLLTVLAHAGHDHGGRHGGAGGLDLLPMALLGIGVAAAVVVLAVIFLMLRRGRAPQTAGEESLEVDVAALPADAPPKSGPQLEIYNVPVRLSLLVLAPVGRSGEIPPSEHLPEVVDAMVPNLMQVLQAHRPQFRRWPPQLSSLGFTNVFFTNVPLPGDAGKGTRWCAAAGRIETPAGPFLAGLVCIAEKPNALGQVAITQPGQWLDILRVKRAT